MNPQLTRISRALVTLFRWWVREIDSVVPPWLRQAARRGRHGFILELGRSETVLLKRTVAGERPFGSAAVGSPHYDHSLNALLRPVHKLSTAITIRLARDLGLHRSLTLPLAALNDLDQLFYFEMDRLTPFKPDQVTYAYRVLEVDHVGQQFSVELHVVQKSEVERAAKTAQRFGLVATRFELAGLPDENREPLNLRSAGQKEPLRKGQRNWAPAVPASILALVALAIPVQRQLATAAQLEAQLSASRTEAEATLALSKRIKELDGRVRFLQAQKTQRVTVIEY